MKRRIFPKEWNIEYLKLRIRRWKTFLIPVEEEQFGSTNQTISVVDASTCHQKIQDKNAGGGVD